ncbi:MAG: D-2-hydroxyacid dehydrogenase [Chloroflexi bacterium]|nr:D-2-hydroxyacid dehydrogenase [Anaerolineaceae bacterium]NMB89756.1 D-2-hydroxyacid dehydrogenase [Chloroflexota bacterium]
MENKPIEVLSTVSFPDQLLEMIHAVSPRLRVSTQLVRRADEIPAEVWARTEVLYTEMVLPRPGQAPQLRWVQFHYAGVDFLMGSPLLEKPDLIFTTLSGAAAPQVAEYVVTMLLNLGHHLPDLFTYQSRAEWPRGRWDKFCPLELRGSTVGIVGYGSIGREVARLLQPFGVRLLAAKRDVMHPADRGYMAEGLGDPEGNLFHRLYPIQALRSMFKECDFVVVALPMTPETQGVIGEEELKALKPSAYVVDVGRGGIISQPALRAALQEQRIAGAALDVFTEEPLPASSPLWKLPNVVITPHISGFSGQYKERAVDMFVRNLELYIAGSPLLNQFDPQRNY